MTTLQQEYLRRLRSETETKMRARQAEHARQMARLAKSRSDLSDAGDFLIGLISAIGLTIMAGIIIWAWLQ